MGKNGRLETDNIHYSEGMLFIKYCKQPDYNSQTTPDKKPLKFMKIDNNLRFDIVA